MQLTPEQIEKLKQTQSNNTRDEALQRPDRRPVTKSEQDDRPTTQSQPSAPNSENTAPNSAIAPQSVQANEAQESAAKMLDLATQSKVEGLQQAAQRGANQAVEEITTEFTAYANVLLQGTEAATAAKAALRAGLNQAAAPGTVAVDFSNFFHLKPAAPTAIEGGN
ncbi:MAG TPA: hypothetical protein V6C65_16155 [Allocoleopsis sp.]